MNSRVVWYLMMVCMVSLGACSSSTKPSWDGSHDRAGDRTDVADVRQSESGLSDLAPPSKDAPVDLPDVPDVVPSDARLPDAILLDSPLMDVALPDLHLADAVH